MAKISRTFCLTSKALKKITDCRENHNYKSDSEALESIIMNEVKVNTEDLKILVANIVTSILNNENITISTTTVETESIIDDEVNKAYQSSVGNIYNTMPD